MGINKHQQTFITRNRKDKEFKLMAEKEKINNRKRLEEEKRRNQTITEDAWFHFENQRINQELREIEKRRDRNAMSVFFGIIGLIIVLLTSFVLGVW